MTIKELRSLYTKYKRLYYARDGLPATRDIKIVWADLRIGLLGQVSQQETGYLIEISPMLKSNDYWRLAKLILMHEMSHMRNWRADHGPWWDEECLRLGSLGALREFF